jgi:hypothetical protein
VALVVTNDELLSQLRLVTEEIRARAINYCDVGSDDPDVAAEGHVLVHRAKNIWTGDADLSWRNRWFWLEDDLGNLMTAGVEKATDFAAPTPRRAIAKVVKKPKPTRKPATFTPDQVLEALGRLVKEDSRDFVQAGDVARLLAPGKKPIHAERVRVGLILSQLAEAGTVQRVRPPDSHRPTRWGLVVAEQ